ncbi:class I SAM-dependent methyltransferase [Methanoregula sp.]|uniref:class I SAM-dependent methyltransferase n=1 Tax=Methanoregula sp. TaxID=2052170 RepID=UPI0035614EA7
MHNRDKEAWEKDYSARGPVWSGAVPGLPFLPVSSRVLELGCGNGKTLAGMLNKGWEVTATDFSRNAVSLCRQVLPCGSSCELTLSDARRLPFRTGSFDCVFAYHVLGHLAADDRVFVADGIERILCPGGSLFFCEFSKEDFRFGKGTETGPGTFVRGNGISTHYFTEEEVRNLFLQFDTESLDKKTWTMRIRGRDYTRSEIYAVFKKQNP